MFVQEDRYHPYQTTGLLNKHFCRRKGTNKYGLNINQEIIFKNFKLNSWDNSELNFHYRTK